ncbi:diguanylate cyclase [Persephonella atlantica]|uniref:diguanylate cyclase n=1 Tax=Persephonella atlantica TaxID=2699429 RepID=A0ABS1GFH9_9AQUI|nr:GGDEF domain-containing protein [Persephonella atlantica]MBK3331674.1 diguanylate cyclase [Persephonella atlantica]
MIHNKVKCEFYSKLRGSKKLSHDDIKLLMNIVRKELSFLIKHNIPPVPRNYEKWFYIFCSLAEQRKELDDLELIGLYKDIYDEDYQAVDIESKEESVPENLAEKFKDIANKLDETLKELISNIDNHQEKINDHADRLVKAKESATLDTISDAVMDILQELKKLRAENNKLKSELKSYHAEVISLKEELSTAKREASIDFLTGLVNRRRFERVLEDAIKDRKLRNYPFSVIFVDVDDFKKVNDDYGHLIGDLVLKELATIFRFYLRANTIIGRLGGEEFAILLPGVELNDAVKIAERLRRIIENREIKVESNGLKKLKITASFGVTEVKDDDTVESVLMRADEAMYRAKKKGKNKVEVLL